ncbi:hypothetical protein BD626DRAFT_402445 [Schizophyllum amplum]|uniref:F-box domain-containing protein n=1 Tax=Schizophyllum amplum TaxID=97359 RepID=A0A550CFH6_9AGAR|nr:hypothetical protein BD626DRAFT_402445 [Auriculariopsis ampla]
MLQFTKDRLNLLHTERFFKTICGFHMGDLDLTGRHRQRYERLRSRFDEVEREFEHMLKAATQNYRYVCVLSPVTGKLETAVEMYHKVEPPHLWDEFTTKWRISRSLFDLDSLREQISQCRATMNDNPMPRLQSLFLLDLPPEVLLYIMSLCHINDLKLWSSTCRTLREHAMCYLYAYCDYRMDIYAVDWPKYRALAADSAERAGAYLRGIALPQRDALEQHMSAINQRHDILDKIRVVSFAEDWTADFSGLLETLGCTESEVIGRAHELLAETLRLSSPTRFVCRAGCLPGDAWKAIAMTPTLRSIAVSARLSDERDDWPSAPAVLNLHMCIGNSSRPINQWHIPLLCTSAIVMKVISMQTWGSVIPEDVFGPFTNNPMAHLQRLDLQNMVADSVFNLAEAIRAVEAAPLTHLSISTRESIIYGDTAFHLVESLRRAPRLRIMHIAGLQYAHPDLFALLGECAPALQTLIVEHRPSESDKQSNSTRWPSPAYEYAPHFATLPRLRHLGLNMLTEGRSYTPKYMERMEGIVDEERLEDDFLDEEGKQWLMMMNYMSGARDGVSDDEARATVTLLAVFCAGLQTVSLDKMDALVNSIWGVDRDIEGRPFIRDYLTEEERDYVGSCMPMYTTNWELSPREISDVLSR